MRKIFFSLFITFFTNYSFSLEIIIGLPYGNHNIGHTVVRVSTFDRDREVIYDFGRYESAWGYLNFQGAGIMRVWRGEKQVQTFLSNQIKFRDSIGYPINLPESDETRIFRYYENKLKETFWSKNLKTYTRYRLRQNYNGVTVQCTSVALEGLKYVLKNENYMKLFPLNFNIGRGFTSEQRKYFFKTQKKLGINEVAVPLDVEAALEFALSVKNPLVSSKNIYSAGKRINASIYAE